MRIGVDFDNTIVCYDGVFHRAGVEKGLVSPTVGTDKDSVRDYLRASGCEEKWTELQGEVYGKHILSCPPYPGFVEFVHRARLLGHLIFIVSHKTRYPFLGPRLDLHRAAEQWLHATGVAAELQSNAVFLELSVDEKLARIATLKCDVFVDDLPEFLSDQGFPSGVTRVLFDPLRRHGSTAEVIHLANWHEAESLLLEGVA